MLPWKYSTKKVQFCKMQTIKIYFIITLVVQYSSAPTRVLKLFHDLQDAFVVESWCCLRVNMISKLEQESWMKFFFWLKYINIILHYYFRHSLFHSCTLSLPTFLFVYFPMTLLTISIAVVHFFTSRTFIN